jgi:hypothetical protein
MIAEDVAEYLKNHPEFFERYAEMISQINIPHPHGGRTIPISERQILSLREKSKQLENKLREMIQYGEENDAIGERMHRLAVALLGAGDLAAAARGAEFSLREDFAVPGVAIRVWRQPREAVTDAASGIFAPLPREVQGFAEKLESPRCTAQTLIDTTALFGDAAPAAKSYAYVALRDSAPFGLLAMASDDPQRFYPDMGTMFLSRLGELLSTAFSRHLA